MTRHPRYFEDRGDMIKRLSVIADDYGPEVAALRAVYVPECRALQPWALSAGVCLECNPFYCCADEWARWIKSALPAVHNAILWLADNVDGYIAVRHFYQMSGLLD